MVSLNEKNSKDIVFEVYRKMYKEATPKADFDKLFESRKTAKPNWFMKHYLNEDRQQEILNEVGKKYKLSKRDRHKLSVEINLGSAPVGSKEAWEDFKKRSKKIYLARKQKTKADGKELTELAEKILKDEKLAEKMLNEHIQRAFDASLIGSGDDMFYAQQAEEYVNKQRKFWIEYGVRLIQECEKEQKKEKLPKYLTDFLEKFERLGEGERRFFVERVNEKFDTFDKWCKE